MKHRTLRSYVVAGLLVWLPILVTLFIINFLVDLFDATLEYLPHIYSPDYLLGFHIPGLGLIFSFVVLILTGIIVRNIIGNRVLALGESVVDRIPLVRAIYKASKQMVETLFSSSGDSFRKVLLIQYPRQGLWTIAFQTGSAFVEIQDKTKEEMLAVFVPTTPNPTAGFLLFLPLREVIELEMSVEEALKTVISLGVVLPNQNGKKNSDKAIT